jgi:hypothetical protein
VNAPAIRLAPAQLHAALWANPQWHVHAVLRGERLPGLADMLARAEVIDHDCLLPGQLEPPVRDAAPWLARLSPQSPFTDWVLSTAVTIAPDFGVLVLAPGTFISVRSHLRQLMQVMLPDGQWARLDWMDPEILALLLPRLEAAQVAAFFGPIAQLMIPIEGGWSRAESVMGQVRSERIALAA